jgi:beta-N-acetylhexosaminidase
VIVVLVLIVGALVSGGDESENAATSPADLALGTPPEDTIEESEAEEAPAPATPSLRELIGQRLMVRMTGVATDQLLKDARRGLIGGVIVFPDPGVRDEELAAAITELQEAARNGGNPPLLVSVDQEGGSVKRLSGPPHLAPLEIADTGDAETARAVGEDTGEYLNGLGINVDLAPVLDVPASSASFIYERSFGTDVAMVASLGTAFADGLVDGSVYATVKHFPGLGRAPANTDESTTVVPGSRSTLEAQDLVPFQLAIDHGVGLVMLATAVYPALDETAPAALSPAVVELLREDLGFSGVTISDDLMAPAVASVAGIGPAGLLAAQAGIDILLYALHPVDAEALVDELSAASRAGSLPVDEVEAAAARILALKEGLQP